MVDKSLKKIFPILVFVAIALLTLCFSLEGSALYYWNAEDNFEKFNSEVAEINRQYGEDYSSRILVKSDRKLADKNSVMSASGYGGLNVFQYESAREANKALAHFSSLSYVDYAVLDGQVKADDPIETEQATSSHDYSKIEDIKQSGHLSWGAELLGIDKYQQAIRDKYAALGMEIPTVYIAVVDTGIDTDNEFLEGRIDLTYAKNFYNQYSNSVEDDNGHGTHVAGTIVDMTLPNVKIIPVKVLGADRGGSLIGVVNGMNYVVQLKKQGVNIAAYNLSVSSFDDGNQGEKHDAVIAAYENNVMAVCSAGNSGYRVEEANPANCERALTISALAENAKYEREYTGASNTIYEHYKKFPHIAYYSNHGSFIDLCLPGSDVLSCVPDLPAFSNAYTSQNGGKYALMSGTSMATPHATGLVALYATYYGSEYSVERVEREIKANTYDFGELGWDSQYGYGVPSMDLALSSVLTTEPTLSFGNIGEECNFSGNSINITVTDNNALPNGQVSKIYYSLDGSMPSILYHEEQVGSINIDKSSLLRFAVYHFDGNTVKGHSKIYEATYYKGDQTVNDDGTGFEINDSGRLISYKSGLKNVVIPTTVNGKAVTGLSVGLFAGLNVESVRGENANLAYLSRDKISTFYCTSTLKSLYVASDYYGTGGITLISAQLAYACFGLKELYLPNIKYVPAATVESSRANGYFGSALFERCVNLEKIVAPKVTQVNAGAFSYYDRLKEAEFDWDNMTTIGNYAFDHCVSLEQDITLGSALTGIGTHVFEGSGITGFTANTLTSVPESAFAECQNLKSIDLSNISTIGANAFDKSGLEYVDLSNVTSIQDNSFTNCEDLLYVIVGSNEYIIKRSAPWLSTYTKILLFDKSYAGQVGSLIKYYYQFVYDFAEYDYKIYASDAIYTVNFLLPGGVTVATRRFMYGDKIVAPESFALDDHATYEFNGWVNESGTSFAQNAMPTAWRNESYVASDFTADYLTAHDVSGWIVTDEANCTDSGYKHKVCNICKFELESEVIPALGHDENTVVERAATCTVGGLEKTVCNRCNEVLVDVHEVPALGHQTQDIVDREPTCTASGVSRTVCTVCESVLSINSIPAAHTEEVIERGYDATCTDEGLTDKKQCSVCGVVTQEKTPIPAKGHDWGEWEPKASDDTKEVRACKECDETEERTALNTDLMREFEEAVAAIKDDMTAEEKFKAIKKAALIWNELTAAERLVVADAHEALSSAIDGYNGTAEEINAEFLSAFEIAIYTALAAVATATAVLASAFMRKKII